MAKPRAFVLGDCSPWEGSRAWVAGDGSAAECCLPPMEFSSSRKSHVAKIRRLADWLMEAALWLEKEAEKGK